MSTAEEDEIKGTVLVAVGVVIGIFMFIFGLTWVIQGNDFFLAKVFDPQREAVRRETFEQSKAYREGMAQELRRMQREYLQATDQQKPALASLIRHQFAGVDAKSLPADLQDFLHEIMIEGAAR